MDNIILRFPDIAEDIFKKLNNKSLIRCTKVSKLWGIFISMQKFAWIRRIQKHFLSHNSEFWDHWKKIIYKIPIRFMKEVVLTLNQIPYYGSFLNNLHVHLNPYFLSSCNLESPLHIAAQFGNLESYEYLYELVGIVNPEVGKTTPLHIAAYFGHLEICDLIMSKIEDKNPRNKFGITPLHYAAMKDHWEICFLIIQQPIEDKNPKDTTLAFGWTPLHVAARENHFDVCKLLIRNTTNKNPEDNFGYTPIHEAAIRSYQKLAKLLREESGQDIHWIHYNRRRRVLLEIFGGILLCVLYGSWHYALWITLFLYLEFSLSVFL